jgi:hypothetical protein
MMILLASRGMIASLGLLVLPYQRDVRFCASTELKESWGSTNRLPGAGFLVYEVKTCHSISDWSAKIEYNEISSFYRRPRIS